MKLKEFVYLLGLKPRPQHYGFVVEHHVLAGDGPIDVAQWQHRNAYRTAPTQAMVDQLRRLLHPGDVAIDIGAHTGDTAIPLALAVGPTGAVLALEPNAHVFPVLAENARLNADKTRIIALPFAAMRTDGEYEFQYGEPGFANGGYHEGMSKWQHGSAFTLRVQGRNLPALLERDYAGLVARIRYIKVDAEGFDLAILETLDAVIRAQRPFLQVEMFDLRKSPADYRQRLYAFLAGHDYVLHLVEGDHNLLGEKITPDNLNDRRRFDVCCIPAECQIRA
ncbi:MAG TPA: FkbM family methyltransferase [Gemmatimonadales bacterium]|nr:FkbM family methyltransferase [Gemmatimonadales bacterium]